MSERWGADEPSLRPYLTARLAFQELLPGIFVAIRARVEAELPEFDVLGVVGELDREEAMRREPDDWLTTPFDWVAFGFVGYEFYDAHVGIVMDTSVWPCTCHVGLHRREHLAETVHSAIAEVDWVDAVGLEPEQLLLADTREYQVRDPARPFDFEDVESELAHFAGRAVAYYRAGARVLS